jgi:hypothetical protein
MILSRYLYFVDDVFYTLERKIIDKYDFKEIIFWISELYYSGYNDDLLWDYLFYIYYKYYFLNYPYIEIKLIKTRNKYFNNEDENKKIELLIDMFKNIYIKNSTNIVVNNYQILEKKIGINELKSRCDFDNLKKSCENIKLKKPKYKLKHNKIIEEYFIDENIQFILDKNKYTKKEINQLKHIFYSLYKTDNIYTYIIFSLVNEINIDILINILYVLLDIKNYKNNKYKTTNVFYKNINNILKLFGLFEQYKNKDEKNNVNKFKKSQFIKSSKKDLNIFIKTNEKIDYLFDTLKTYRIYSIISNEKNKELIKKKNYIQHYDLWEYYIFGCPLWDKRIKKFNIIRNPNYICNFDINTETYDMISSNNDDNIDSFYSLYNYELQEQSLDIINKGCWIID